MIPSISLLENEIEERVYHDKTYKIELMPEGTSGTSTVVIGSDQVGAEVGQIVLGVSKLGVVESESKTITFDDGGIHRINGLVDGIESLTQAIYCILSTERYKYIIYSWDYGVELVDLIGKPIPYVMAELPRRIKEALLVDNRITDVVNFEFERNGKSLHTTFTVVTNIGNINAELEVEV